MRISLPHLSPPPPRGRGRITEGGLPSLLQREREDISGDSLSEGRGGNWGDPPQILPLPEGGDTEGISSPNPPPSLWEGGGLRWGIGIFFLNVTPSLYSSPLKRGRKLRGKGGGGYRWGSFPKSSPSLWEGEDIGGGGKLPSL